MIRVYKIAVFRAQAVRLNRWSPLSEARELFEVLALLRSIFAMPSGNEVLVDVKKSRSIVRG